jgi:hypothetical protein
MGGGCRRWKRAEEIEEDRRVGKKNEGLIFFVIEDVFF